MLYEEIQSKIEELKVQAEIVKREEKQQAIDMARAMIQSFGITAKDLGLDKACLLYTSPSPRDRG